MPSELRIRIRDVVAGIISVCTLTSFTPVIASEGAPEIFAPAARVDGIAALDALLGFPSGERSATYGEISRCLDAWAATSDRVRLVEHGQTWEGRTMRHLIVSSPENLARLDQIRAGWDRVADARLAGAADAEQLASTLPAVAWLAFSIHGDEVSGADAALVLADHLISSRDPEVAAMLRDLVVIFDPSQNPDGRDRYLARIRETSGRVPNLDGQSVQKQGSWPQGRTNHYLFDLNRDWVFGTQPETRGRVAALAGWRPLFFLDVHEMGLDSPFLFYPPRPPFNPFLPRNAVAWWGKFGRDEATAFDRQGWRYYTGEWADWWFPGYSDSFGTLRGAIGILHEQGGVSGSARLDNGEIITYRESVAHQATAAWANLRTLAANRVAIAVDFSRERRRAMADGGPLAGRSLAVVPDRNRSRLQRFVETVTRLGGEIDVLGQAQKLRARDPLGETVEKEFPAGTLIVRGRQPNGAMIRATLDFDHRLPREVLEKERAALVAGKGTLLYDISGWSLPLLFGLDAFEIDSDLPGVATTRLVATAPAAAAAGAQESGRTAVANPVAWVIDGADDASVSVAERLLESGIHLRFADKAFELDGIAFARGSVLALRDDNRARAGELATAVSSATAGLDLEVRALATGLGEDELPDLGGGHFLRLERPRVALVGYGEAEVTAFGALWYALDHEIGAPTSLLEAAGITEHDLRRYNVIVLAPGIDVDEERAKALHTWVESGGTLIAVAGSADAITRDKSTLTSVRRLADAGDDLPAFRSELVAGWSEQMPAMRDTAIDRALAGRIAGASALPAIDDGAAALDKAERQRREASAERFAPQGTLLAGRIDPDHWLTVGTSAMLPLFVAGDPVLLAKAPAEAPVRLGILMPAAASPGAPAKKSGGWHGLGWSAVPDGQELILRLSGLLWPEAAERYANAAYLVREALGSGQVVLFAGDPVWRGAALGSQRLFANAVVYGPGCGASTAVIP
ncbi:MAG: M14 family metallopeptidase [Thermoanaerobaculia bacterium]